MESNSDKDVMIILTVDDVTLFFKENHKEIISIILPWLKGKKQITAKELKAINEGKTNLELRFQKEQIHIQDLPLSTQTKNLLLSSKIYTVDDVKALGRNGLLGIRNFGKKRLEALENLLKRRNHSLDDLNNI